ncbi:MAG: sulfite exporter TauE/SafE family protein [Bifidobacteriaceae bacterium]|nr:sulfite exporter TauE/SafE family protein [Bifidobacteriaceae bacterium]
MALATGALGVGFAKTAIGGVGSICVALYAAVLPAKYSTGLLLLLLLTGDLVAISIYRRDVAWKSLARLFLPVVAGVLVGAWFMDHINDATLRITIAIVLLSMVALHIGSEVLARHRARPATAGGPPEAADPAEVPAATPGPAAPGETAAAQEASTRAGRLALNLGYGSLAGFATMVANAGGAPMNLYLLAAKFSMLRFLGTAAWFFFFVNVFKLPFSIRLGLIDAQSWRLWAVLAPLVLIGAWAGRVLIKRLNQKLFNHLVIVFTAVPAIALFF